MSPPKIEPSNGTNGGGTSAGANGNGANGNGQPPNGTNGNGRFSNGNNGNGRSPNGINGNGRSANGNGSRGKIGSDESTVTFPAPIKPGNSGAEDVKVDTNFFGMVIERENDLYRYDVVINGTSQDVADFSEIKGAPVQIAKKTSNDYYSAERKSMCQSVLELILRKFPDEFVARTLIFYDMQSIMYSTEKLPFQQEVFMKLMQLTPEEAVGPLREMKLIEVHIKACAKQHKMSVGAFRELDSSLMGIKRDRTIFHFVQTALIHHALHNPSDFLVFEKGKVILKDAAKHGVNPLETIKLPNDKELKVGAKFSVQSIEGPQGRARANLAVAIDAKKVAFHLPSPMTVKAISILPGFDFSTPCNRDQLDRLNSGLRGIMIKTTHSANTKPQKIIDVRMDSSATFTSDGKQVTVLSYYKEKYNVTLLAPLAPLIVVQSKKETFYPMEVCVILEGQRVTFSQQTAEQMKESTKECAVPPLRRQTLIATNLAANMTQEAKDAGIDLILNPIRSAARILPPAELRYNGSTTSTVDVERYSWKHLRNVAYLLPGRVGVWVFVVVGKQRVPPVTQFIGVAERIYDEAKARGVAIDAPAHCTAILGTELENFFKLMSENKVEYILMVTDDQLTNQDQIKSLERRYEIMTQNIRMKTAKDIVEKSKAATVENLVQKLNIKAGGLNYSVKINGTTLLENGETLVVGLGAAVPPMGITLAGGLMPTVVGYAANISTDIDGFSGEFDIVDSKLATNQLIGGHVMRRVLDEWIKMGKVTTKSERKRPTKLPSKVVFYRTGIQESEFDSMATKEISAIKQVLKDVSPDKEIQLIFIAVSKDHSARFFRPIINSLDRPNKQNILPGTTIDQQVTSPKLRQFYLNSHVALQGTALTPLYTILHDDHNAWSMDTIERLTFDLCFMHQIVNLTTSLPTPLYVANKYADRGRRMVIQFVENAGKAGTNLTTIDLLNEEQQSVINYKKSKFANIRVNA